MELKRYRHYAMATTYEIVVPAGGKEEQQAAAFANAAFEELDRLEEEISRFRPGSDVWRINQTSKGDVVHVGMACFDCLSLAKELDSVTGGAFDVTIGPLMNVWRSADGDPSQVNPEEIQAARERVGTHLFELNPENLRVQVFADRIELDFGALGKGYALDQIAEMLVQWEIGNAVLNAGQSTVFATGPGADPEASEPGWPVTAGSRTLRLRDQALSGSGFAVLGAHIIDPRSGQPVEVREQRTYALAPTAAVADALSTAFTLMSPEAIQGLCETYPGLAHLAEEPDAD